MNNEEINNILELSKNDKNLHHKKGHGGLLFITLSMIQFSKLKRYIKQLQRENKELKELLDTILTFDFFEYECPLNLGFEENAKETEAQNVFYEDEYCENNCNDCYKKCWLKYFERLKELERGVSDE